MTTQEITRIETTIRHSEPLTVSPNRPECRHTSDFVRTITTTAGTTTHLVAPHTGVFRTTELAPNGTWLSVGRAGGLIEYTESDITGK